MVVIKWTNKFSGETGYVKSVSTKEKHFNNTYEQNDARQYASETTANKAISNLIGYGEAENNNFEVVTV